MNGVITYTLIAIFALSCASTSQLIAQIEEAEIKSIQATIRLAKELDQNPAWELANNACIKREDSLLDLADKNTSIQIKEGNESQFMVKIGEKKFFKSFEDCSRYSSLSSL